MDVLTSEHIQNTLTTLGVDTKITFYGESTATSQQAADQIGCKLGQIAKSLCFMVNKEPLLVIASGDQRVDTKKLSTRFEVGRKKVKTAKPEECIAIFGYAPGGVPPVAHRTPDIPILIDDSLSRFEQLYAAGGASNAIFPITLDQLINATKGEIADVKQE